MASRVTQTTKVVLVGLPSNARVTQVVKIVLVTVAPTASAGGLRTMGVGS